MENEKSSAGVVETASGKTVVSIYSQEALDLYQKSKTEGKRPGGLSHPDSHICACGHPVRVHQDAGVPGVTRKLCTPGRQKCPCKVVRPVLASSNLRVFMGRTDGVGALHALGKGISGLLIRRKDKAVWLDKGKFPVDADGDSMIYGTPGVHGSVVCDICLVETYEPVPVAVAVADSAEPVMADHSTGVDKLVCMGCFLKWDEETLG